MDKHTQIALPSLDQAPTLYQQQLLRIHYPEQKNHAPVLVVLQSSPQHIALTVLSTLGIKLAQAQYNGREIKVENQPLLAKMPPANQVLGDILFTLLPPQSWQLPEGWKMTEQHNQRFLYDPQHRLVMRVTYKNTQPIQPVLLENVPFNYQIHIETLPTANQK
ncbi:DUF3261 domain-containing protein [Pasteurella sp. PK-2025]|uniref:DUF3261 domain-containing protein n=1 Tax=unclassified Pasteurella TaxID=2621516 RepID=UPI003C734E0E